MKVVLTTCQAKDAPAIVQQLLEARLIGCGNIIDSVLSMYWWKGEIQRDPEALIIMETPDDVYPSMLERLIELHPYDVPKILALEPSNVLEAYQTWLQEETRA